jgi:hypothetical protein
MPIANIIASPHWPVFTGTPFVPQGPVGAIPTQWVAQFGLIGVPMGAMPLPNFQLTRKQVRAICQNPANPVEYGYVCAMAWGGQGGRNGSRDVVAAWNNRALWIPKLATLRTGGLNRMQAFDLFSSSAGNAVRGIGPAYFTKLLYFFSPDLTFYIMDQWTAKSMNLLNNFNLVRMSGNAVYYKNKGGNYQAFCEDIDSIAQILGVSGAQIEEHLFSRGNRAGRGIPPLPWRLHVKANWPSFANFNPTYNAAIPSAAFPNIPATNF